MPVTFDALSFSAAVGFMLSPVNRWDQSLRDDAARLIALMFAGRIDWIDDEAIEGAAS